MESVIAQLLKFRRPVAACIGFGLGALATLGFWPWPVEIDLGFQALVAISGGVAGTGVTIAIFSVSEIAWKETKEFRSAIKRKRSSALAERKLTNASDSLRQFLIGKLINQSPPSEYIEFEAFETHHAQKLVDQNLARKINGRYEIKLNDETWICICENPNIIGLELKYVWNHFDRDARIVFKRME